MWPPLLFDYIVFFISSRHLEIKGAISLYKHYLECLQLAREGSVHESLWQSKFRAREEETNALFRHERGMSLLWRVEAKIVEVPVGP